MAIVNSNCNLLPVVDKSKESVRETLRIASESSESWQKEHKRPFREKPIIAIKMRAVIPILGIKIPKQRGKCIVERNSLKSQLNLWINYSISKEMRYSPEERNKEIRNYFLSRKFIIYLNKY